MKIETYILVSLGLISGQIIYDLIKGDFSETFEHSFFMIGGVWVTYLFSYLGR